MQPQRPAPIASIGDAKKAPKRRDSTDANILTARITVLNRDSLVATEANRTILVRLLLDLTLVVSFGISYRDFSTFNNSLRDQSPRLPH